MTVRNLTGKRFGKLTAVRKVTELWDTEGKMWECICDCGETSYVRSYSLISGKTRSCGCLRRESKMRNLTDRKFGRLTAICPTEERDSKGSVMWECRCDCGNTTVVSSTVLLMGGTKSCGCLRRENRFRESCQSAIADWRTLHPDGTKEECAKDTGVSVQTVRKWWNS